MELQHRPLVEHLIIGFKAPPSKTGCGRGFNHQYCSLGENGANRKMLYSTDPLEGQPSMILLVITKGTGSKFLYYWVELYHRNTFQVTGLL
ncbi:hypothetical protein NPIL_214351 [Nephila pilipes]|uniref:Uncharacterized protein n=1 Tax=Nephila pilipes TaxID=299642 RepID=A0A8X6TEZ2_NEPPI|nr:hypothetical protein NPIL_214351 [Nephila pilipes]